MWIRVEFISGRTALRRLELIPSCPVVVVLAFFFFFTSLSTSSEDVGARNMVLDILKDFSGEVKLGSGGGMLSAREDPMFVKNH